MCQPRRTLLRILPTALTEVLAGELRVLAFVKNPQAYRTQQEAELAKLSILTAGQEDVLMTFKEQPLDKTVDWENVPGNRFIMITGKNTIVYWKGCNVTAYEKDGEGNEQTRKLVGVPDGQGIVEYGDKLYVTDGKVKEG